MENIRDNRANRVARVNWEGLQFWWCPCWQAESEPSSDCHRYCTEVEVLMRTEVEVLMRCCRQLIERKSWGRRGHGDGLAAPLVPFCQSSASSRPLLREERQNSQRSKREERKRQSLNSRLLTFLPLTPMVARGGRERLRLSARHPASMPTA
jgi:hypothetical protein